MPINADPSHTPKFCLFVAKTGGGKSQMVRKVVPQSRARVVGWDRGYAHKGLYFDSRENFKAALNHVLTSKKKAFRLFYTGSGGDAVADHEWWARLLWESDFLDGRYINHVIDEELAETGGTVNRAKPMLAKLINQGRKFGLIHYGTTQRPTEIPKTITENAAFLYIGQLKAATIKYYADNMELGAESLRALRPLQFYCYDDKVAKKVSVKYKQPKIINRQGYVQVA